MNSTDVNAKEVARLKELHDFLILDTDPEKQLDQLTELTANIFKMPIALISLIDKDRQWFKSSFGINIKETPRDISFCTHTILEDSIFEVKDSLEDPKFKNNVLVTGPEKIRYYAGAPLKTSNNHNIGSLCVIDHQPRSLSDNEKKQLRTIADQIVSNMEFRKSVFSHRKLFDHQQSLLESLNKKNYELNEFSYRTSHDLRAPVVRIQRLADYCIEDIEKEKYDEAEKNCHKIIKNCVQMDELVTSIGEYTQAGQTTEQKSLISFKDLENWIINELDNKHPNTKVKIGFKVNATADFYCEKMRLYKLCFNLMSNGVKFSNPKVKSPFVFMNIELVDHELLIIHVKDNGTGIPDKYHKSLFKIFAKFHPTLTDGSGLGLGVVKKHVDMLKGEIQCKSSASGTEFLVNIPNQEKLSE